MDAPRIKELISSRKSSVTVEQMQTENGKCAWKLNSLRHNSSRCIAKIRKQCIDDSLLKAICRYELASENDCKVLSWITSINKDGNGTQLGAFLRMKFQDRLY